MVEIIAGKKGKGKTKYLLDKVNTSVENASGNIVYLDKSTKHMYELNNKIRLIDVSAYLITSPEEFLGFVCGIVSQDHDLQQMYFDSFLKIACAEEAEIEPIIKKLDAIGEKFGIDFVLSVSRDEAELPASLKEKIIVSL